MPHTYRPAHLEEFRDLVVSDALAFGSPTDPGSIERGLASIRLDELRVFEEDGVRIGMLIARPHRVWWGGRAVPAGQVSGVSIEPGSRGRGAAGELMRAYLAEAHERGAAISTLFPATVHLYRRLGYEYAGTWTLYSAPARSLPHTWPDGWRAVPVPADDPAPFQERFARVAPGRSGQVDRDADWWRHNQLADHGAGRPQGFLVDGPDGPDGWAILRSSTQETPTDWDIRVNVLDWGAASGDGWRSLLALAAGHSSLGATVIWKGPEPEPLVLLLREQDVRHVHQVRWMARVLDVAGAFGGRGYPPDLHGRVTIRVADEICPWVAGTWTIEVEGGEGKAARVDATAAGVHAAETDAGGLSALFAGYIDPGDLLRLGLVRGLDEEGCAFLAAMHAGPKPWSPDFY